MTAKNRHGDASENIVIQKYKARQAAKDLNQRHIQQALFGSPTAASALGDQEKAALESEEALRLRAKPPKHRK